MMLGEFGLPELLIILVVLVFGAFWIRMLILAAQDGRIGWVLVIVVLGVVGAAVYYFVRRTAPKASLAAKSSDHAKKHEMSSTESTEGDGER